MSVFERGTADEFATGARALIVVPDSGRSRSRSVEAELAEAVGLSRAIALDCVETATLRVRAARPATLFGSGQVASLAQIVAERDIEVVVVDGSLTPVQQRNLERELKAKVIDRTALILEIFGERAATAEGRLQVELAHLDYQAGRLVRSWTHLERQRGGFGFLGGPGETQIEADRRMIRNRMARIRAQLSDVRRTRALQRTRRQRAPWPVVALVGYTNAGKSTLFNRLTQSDVMAEDLLFATLDPAMRAISLPGIEKAIVSDTVGFVSNLPTELIAAFRATLEEVLAADLIVHVRDIAHPDSEAQRADVEAVLASLGVRIGEGSDADSEGDSGKDKPSDAIAVPILEVWNKADLIEATERDHITGLAARRDDVVLISALGGEGVEVLRQRLAELLRGDTRVETLHLPNEAGAALAWLHANADVLAQRAEADGMAIDVRWSPQAAGRYAQRWG